jgi:hypothetical protein
MESNPQMPHQSAPNQGQDPHQGYAPSTQEAYPQMSVQPGQYPPPSPYQGYVASPQGYSQTVPNPPYQQMSPLPNQGPMSGSQSGRPPRILRRSRGLKMMLRGVILLVGGIVLSLISYSCASSAADSGGTGYYTIFTGAMIIGAIYAIFGFFRWIMGR